METTVLRYLADAMDGLVAARDETTEMYILEYRDAGIVEVTKALRMVVGGSVESE